MEQLFVPRRKLSDEVALLVPKTMWKHVPDSRDEVDGERSSLDVSLQRFFGYVFP